MLIDNTYLVQNLNKLPVKKAIRHFLILGILFTSFSVTFSQRSAVTGSKFKVNNKKKKRKPLNYINHIDLIGNIGNAAYLGDLCNGMECVSFSATAGLGIQYRYNESLMFRAEANYIRLKGSDEGGQYEQARGLSFRSDNVEFVGTVIYDIFEYNKMYRRRHLVSPYLQVGLGLLYYNPKALYDGKYYDLRALQTEGVKYNSITAVIPYGLGVRFKINPHINVSTEMNWRFAFSDYLDDVSDRYDESKSDLNDDEIAKILSDRRENYLEHETPHSGIRGSTGASDYYFIFNVKLAYTIKVTKQRYNINSNVSRFRIIKSIKKK